jgi:hypothetical protein
MYRAYGIVASALLLIACGMASPSGMPTNIVPVTPPTITTSLDIPSDGEVANSLSLQLFAEPLNTDVEAFRQLTYGGGLRRRVTCTSNTVMTVQPYGAIVVLSSTGEWIVFQAIGSAIPLNPTTLTGGLSASTRYYVYIYESGGIAAYTASTTGPDVGLKYKTGDQKYFFLSSFITDSASNVVLYSQTDNHYVYTYRTSDGLSGAADGNLAIYRKSTDGSQALGYSIPSGAKSATLMAFLLAGGGGPATAAIGPTGANPLNAYLYAPTSASVSQEFSISLAVSTTVDYVFVAAPSYMDLWVTGFDY